MVRDSIGVIYLKIITEKGGVKARSVNDRSIEHSISQKTELSKKNEKALSGKTERTVRRSEKDELMPHHSGSASTDPRQFVERKEHASGKAADRKIPLSKSATSVGVPRTEIKTSGSSEKITPIPFRPPKQYKLSPHQPKNKKYKVLKNGTVANGTLTKRKERVIYSQQQNKKLLSKKKKTAQKEKNANALNAHISFESISNGIIHMKSKGKPIMCGVLAITGMDIYNLKEYERNAVFDNMERATMSLRANHKYIFTAACPYLQNQKNFIKYKAKQSINKYASSLLDEQFFLLDSFEKNHRDRMAYLLIYDKSEKNIHDDAER